MSIKIKYDANGLKEAEVTIDPQYIKNQKMQQEYLKVHEFISDVLENRNATTAEPQKDREAKRSHNKSKPHYRVDIELAKIIIDAGGLKHLHGVNILGDNRAFFFDKVDMIQKIVERYNKENSKGADGTAPTNGNNGSGET